MAAVDHESGVTQYGFHDSDRVNDPKLSSRLSSIGVLVFWFS